ncbi:MAG: hypothetical protein AB7H97_22065, partial [Pseudobdellovibrionaceae bacterium]
MSKTFLVSPHEYFATAVREALQSRRVETYPQVESYIVELLKHYMLTQNLYEQNSDGTNKIETLAEMFLRASNSETNAKVELLKRLADMSLYVSGFFGDSLARKLVDIDYYADIGGSAYVNLASSVREDLFSQVYLDIGSRFLVYVDVLAYISEKSFIESDQSILSLYDRYIRTGSELAREKLVEKGVVTL